MSLYRQWVILTLIPREPGKITAQEVLSRLGGRDCELETTVRTIQRDLVNLQRYAVFGLQNDGLNPLGWYFPRSARRLDIPAMDPEAALTLKLAKLHLLNLMPTSMLENLRDYFERAEAVLDSRERIGHWVNSVGMASRSLVLKPAPVRPEVLDVVYQAVFTERRLRIGYRPRRSPDIPLEYEINPLGIVLREPSVYLAVTTMPDVSTVKQMVLHRIDWAELLEEPRVIPEGFDLSRYIREEQGFGYQVENQPAEINLVLRTVPTLTYKLSETPLSPDQRIDPEGGERALVTATVANTWQLRNWLMEQGPQVEVVEPTELRSEIVGWIRDMLAHYADAR